MSSTPARLLDAAGLAILLGLGSCGAMEPTPAPAGTEALRPPAAYREWWSKTERCSGLRGRFEDVEWFVVPGVSSFPTELGEKVGLWTRTPTGSRIVIAGDLVMSELVVRHEILHELLRREGHPEPYFETLCHLTWESWHLASGR